MTALDGQAWGIGDAAELVAEIDRDLGEREGHYPELVRKGRLSQAEADYLVGLVRDIREDLLFAFAPVGEGEIRGTYERPDCRVTWAAKVRWLEGEDAERRAAYVDLVRKGRIEPGEAKRRIAAIECLRRLYWNKLFQWRPPEGPALEYLKASKAAALSGARAAALRDSEGAKIYRELVRRHLAAVELEDGAQGELAA